MRWYTVLESWESVSGESSSLGVANARFFFLFFFPSDVFFLSFSFPHEADECFPIITIYYFARYSCIAYIMLLKPMFVRSLRSFRNENNKCFLGFFFNNSNKKMLAPHAVDIEVLVTISSLIASLCFTFAEPFDDSSSLRQVKLCIDQRKYNKSLRPKDRPIDPNDQAREFALAH